MLKNWKDVGRTFWICSGLVIKFLEILGYNTNQAYAGVSITVGEQQRRGPKVWRTYTFNPFVGSMGSHEVVVFLRGEIHNGRTCWYEGTVVLRQPQPCPSFIYKAVACFAIDPNLRLKTFKVLRRWVAEREAPTVEIAWAARLAKEDTITIQDCQVELVDSIHTLR